MILEILILILVGTYIVLSLLQWRSDQLTQNIPKISRRPIIGSLIPGSSPDLWNIAWSETDKYASMGIVKMWIGTQLIIGIWDPALIEAVGGSPNLMNKGNIYKHAFDGQGILVVNGPEWKELRKPFTKSLGKRYLEEKYFTIFLERSNHFVKFLNEKKLGRVTDVKDDISNLLLDIFCETHFGICLNEVRDQKWEFLKNFHKLHVHRWNMVFKYGVIFPKLIMKVLRPDLLLEMRNHKRKVQMFLDMVLRERKDRCEESEGAQVFLADVLLRRGAEKNLPIHVLRGQLMDFVLAGSETTSMLVSSALLFLAMYPDYQEEAFREQLTITSGRSLCAEVEQSDLPQMKYLERVISETLRLMSPSGVAKFCEADTKIGDYILPKGCWVFVFITRTQRDPRYWTQPNSFYPDHFTLSSQSTRHRCSYVPFGIGPRACPGFQYGINAAKVILASIIRNFTLTTPLKFKDLVFNLRMFVDVENEYLIQFNKR